jgi:hypothetical protein
MEWMESLRPTPALVRGKARVKKDKRTQSQQVRSEEAKDYERNG